MDDGLRLPRLHVGLNWSDAGSLLGIGVAFFGWRRAWPIWRRSPR